MHFFQKLPEEEVEIPDRIIKQVFFEIDDGKAIRRIQDIVMLKITMAEITILFYRCFIKGICISLKLLHRGKRFS